MRFVSFFILFVFVHVLEAKAPELSPKDVKVKVEEIFRAHVSHRELTKELMKRVFLNYVEMLDPTKTYLIDSEIVKWISPSDELLDQAISDFKKESFTKFEELHEKIVSAIERRNRIEKEVASMALPAKVPSIEIKELQWAKNEEELKERVLLIRALQMDAAERLDSENRLQLLKKFEKRRIKREEEIASLQSPRERQKQVLTFILKAVSGALDSQTAYFTPSEANQFVIQVQQRLFGIGAELRDDLNGFSITRLLDGGPALNSGKLKAGDKIIAVNNEAVVGMEISEAVELIRGPQGTTVNLTVLREIGDEEKQLEKIDVAIVRREVVLKETRFEAHYEPFGDGVIGILRLFSFYQDMNSSSATDLRKEIERLKAEHKLQGLILDLRNNAGGLLPQAVAVSGLFIKKGVVVSVKDNTGVVQHLRNIDGKVVWDGPLVILTNRTSASAAEIVAQSLQDYGRAVVVGDETTYGKGTFQTFSLEASQHGKVNPKGEYKVTRGRYYTVSGKSPQLTGVKADVVVPGIFTNMEIGEKFSRYPVENDEIAANFEDRLEDIPSSHREQLLRLYKMHLQPILSRYKKFLPKLQKNSKHRLEMNKNYQNFLKEISNKDIFPDRLESCGQTDLQQYEAVNIMKDLIVLNEQKEVEMLPTGSEG